MNKTIFNNVSRTFHRAGFKIKKHSPEILIVGGVIGTVVGAVMACKATLKAPAIIDDAKVKIDKIHKAAETGVTEAGEEYSVEDSKKELAGVYVKTGFELAKLYAPSVVVGTLSISSTVASNGILRKRNAALAAAYATIDAGFKEYSGRVIERFGKELDHELRYNIKATEVEEVVTDEEGNEKTVKTTVHTVDPNMNSVYARFFDETCPAWEKNAEDNLYFLRCQQTIANQMLQSRGHLYLNEVYDLLGMQRSEAGQIVGWVYDEKHPVGDNFVDFGIYDLYDEQKRLFVNGHERSILLDFNVDGNILKLMN